MDVAASAPVAKSAPAKAGALGAQRANAAVTRIFDALTDVLAGLPGGPLAGSLEGALLLARRTLFNQAPTATPVQLTTTSEGQILGSIGGRDPEGDAVTYSVVSGPQFGTVAVAPDGNYTYTPGVNYAGSDSFTVQIACDGEGFNLLSPGGHGSAEVVVGVGSLAATNPFTGTATHQDPIDAALRLDNASADISVSKKMGRLTATVALTNVTPETQLLWMDATGRTGQVSVAEVAATHWDEYASAAEAVGGGVTLGIVYQGADGAEQALILTKVKATVDPDGQVLFTGVLAPNAKSKAGYENDFWDVLGSTYKARYEAFREQVVDVKGFKAANFSVTDAVMYADTYTVADYEAVMTSKDDPGIRFDSVEPAPSASTDVPAFDAGVTATMAFGDKVVAGLADGSVKMWDGKAWQRLAAPSPDFSTNNTWFTERVTDIEAYGDGFVIGRASGSVEQWTGTEWKPLVQATLEDTNCKKYGSCNLEITAYKSGLAVALSFTGESVGYTSIYDWDGQRWANRSYSSALVTDLVRVADGYAFGLKNGKLEYFTGSEFKTLRDDYDFWGYTEFSALAPVANGLLVGRKDGSVLRYNTGTGQWSDLGQSEFDSRVKTMMAVRDNGAFVAGLDNGEVVLYDDNNGTRAGQWFTLKDDGWDSSVSYLAPGDKGDNFVVALRNGSVQQYAGNLAEVVAGEQAPAWKELLSPRDLGSYGSTTGLVPYKDGYALSVRKTGASDEGGRVFLWSASAPGNGWSQPDPSWSPFSADVLKKGVVFAQTIYKQTDGTSQILTNADPIFGLADNKAGCEAAKTCTGQYYKLAYATDPESMINLWKKQWNFTGQTDQSVNVAYDIGLSSYGYLFVPDGTWDKLDPEKFAAGLLLGVTTGPSMNLNLAGRSDGQLNIAQGELAAIPGWTSPPGPYGSVSLTPKLTGGITADLDLPADFASKSWYKNKLSASFYWTPGMLVTLNTVGNSGLGFGFDSYGPTLDYADFEKVQGVTISPSITPSVELAWGYMVPDSAPSWVAGKSLAKLAVGYENPVSVNLALASGKDPSLTLGSEGNVTFSAGVLDFVTSSLTYKTTFEVYKTKTGNLLESKTV